MVNDLQKVLDFWLSEQMRNYWFKLNSNPSIIQEIKQKFSSIYNKYKESITIQLTAPQEYLALIILFEQLPKYILPQQASPTSYVALMLAKIAIAKGYDQAIKANERALIYLPLQHSQSAEDNAYATELLNNLPQELPINTVNTQHDQASSIANMLSSADKSQSATNILTELQQVTNRLDKVADKLEKTANSKDTVITASGRAMDRNYKPRNRLASNEQSKTNTVDSKLNNTAINQTLSPSLRKIIPIEEVSRTATTADKSTATRRTTEPVSTSRTDNSSRATETTTTRRTESASTRATARTEKPTSTVQARTEKPTALAEKPTSSIADKSTATATSEKKPISSTTSTTFSGITPLKVAEKSTTTIMSTIPSIKLFPAKTEVKVAPTASVLSTAPKTTKNSSTANYLSSLSTPPKTADKTITTTDSTSVSTTTPSIRTVATQLNQPLVVKSFKQDSNLNLSTDSLSMNNKKANEVDVTQLDTTQLKNLNEKTKASNTDVNLNTTDGNKTKQNVFISTEYNPSTNLSLSQSNANSTKNSDRETSHKDEVEKNGNKH